MKYIKRNITDDIKEYLKHFPALLINGARQVGKSTLTLHLDIENYITFDDINIYEMAKNNPQAFIENIQKPVIIDEIQRFPTLFGYIKEYIDKDEKNGQFILIENSSIRGIKDISHSLSGKIGIIDLYPLSLKEKGVKTDNIIDIFSKDLDSFISKVYNNSSMVKNIIKGGYPQAQNLQNKKARYLWFSSYIRTYIESDAKELSNIRNVKNYINLYRLCMLKNGSIFNKNELQNESNLDNKTFDNYFNTLQNTYQITKLAPYSSIRLKRVVKTPKIFATDTGILSHLLQIDTQKEYEVSNHKDNILKTFIFNELLKAKTYANDNAKIFFYKTSDNKSIDFILDFSYKIIAIDVNPSKNITKKEFKHIYRLAKSLPDKFDKGIIFYNGDTVLKFDQNMYAFPIGFLG